jgi:hypothetical protein
MLRGALDPLFFELGTELAFPIPPGTIGVVLTVWVHLVMILFLSVPSSIINKVTMMAMAVAMALCGWFVALVKEQYRRRDVDVPGESGAESE